MKQRRIIAAVGFALVASVVAAACGGSSGDGSEGGTPTKGGTIHILSNGEQIAHLDPQRNYTGDDLAFAGSTMHRTLTSYKYAAGDEGSGIVPDLATDLGTFNEDGTCLLYTSPSPRD